MHHGLVDDARKYKWCSAGWFERSAPAAFARAVGMVKLDKVKIYDEF